MAQVLSNTRFFSIKWQTFALTSLLLVLLFGSFFYFVSRQDVRQFENDRQQLYVKSRQQLESLIKVAADKTLQLANTALTSKPLMQMIASGNREALQQELNSLLWNLQLDAGVENILVYANDGQLLATAGEPQQQALAREILQTEQPLWTVRCPSGCFIDGGIPVLQRGLVVGALILSEPLSNVMLRFQELSKLDTGLLSPSTKPDDVFEFIPAWQQSLVAITNPESNRAIINRAASRFSFDQLQRGVRMRVGDQQFFELRAVPLENNQMVMIADVSRDFLALQQQQDDNFKLSLLVLVIAEFVLLVLLWRPMARVREFASLIPLLAEHRLEDVQQTLQALKPRTLFRDETDLLANTALRLGSELKQMKTRLQDQDEALEYRQGQLDSERGFALQLLDSVNAIILIQDDSGRIQLGNDLLQKLTGYSTLQLKSMQFEDILVRDRAARTAVIRLQDVASGDLTEYQHEATLLTDNQDALHLVWRHSVLFHESLAGPGKRQILSVAVDVSARIKAEAELAWLSSHDPVTGCHNRRVFEEQLGTIIQEYLRFGRAFSVVLIEPVVAGNGHGAEQASSDSSPRVSAEQITDLMREIGANVRVMLRPGDTLARVGQSEFALVYRQSPADDLEEYLLTLTAELEALTLDTDYARYTGRCYMGGINLIADDYQKITLSADAMQLAVLQQVQEVLAIAKNSNQDSTTSSSAAECRKLLWIREFNFS